VVMEVLAGLADLLAGDGALAPAHELIAHILDTPAAGQAARERAERLRDTLAGTHVSTPIRPLELVLESVWKRR
jgi:hypothetical protein